MDLHDHTVGEHRSGQGHKRISQALGPRTTVASIIVRVKKLGTAWNFPRDVCSSKLSIWERKAMRQGEKGSGESER